MHIQWEEKTQKVTKKDFWGNDTRQIIPGKAHK